MVSSEASVEELSCAQQVRYQQKIVETVRRYRLWVPAIFFLELVKPLATLGACVLDVISPLFQFLGGQISPSILHFFLSDRRRLEALIVAIEEDANGF